MVALVHIFPKSVFEHSLLKVKKDFTAVILYSPSSGKKTVEGEHSNKM